MEPGGRILSCQRGKFEHFFTLRHKRSHVSKVDYMEIYHRPFLETYYFHEYIQGMSILGSAEVVHYELINATLCSNSRNELMQAEKDPYIMSTAATPATIAATPRAPFFDGAAPVKACSDAEGEYGTTDELPVGAA